MSIYEMYDYDTLLDRIGINHAQTWRCGANPPVNWRYQEDGLRYDDIFDSADASDSYKPFGSAYDGRAQHLVGGLCLGSDINVNGLLLNFRDVNNTVWICTGIEGWWTLPPAEIEDVPRPYWDGSMLTTGRYLTRTITVNGCFLPKDPSLVWYNRDLVLRSCSIVRGIGLLATCGNASRDVEEDSDGNVDDPFYDPSKMAIIQMADVPLVDTTKPNGFTQFSMSFKCVQPSKLSIIEHNKELVVTPDGKIRERLYASFSHPYQVDPLHPEWAQTTTYEELRDLVPDVDGEPPRTYTDVKNFNLATPIPDEDFIYKETDTGDDPDNRFDIHNKGNYFSFPIFVFKGIQGASPELPVTLLNKTTGELMSIIASVPDDMQLVVDTAARRVAYVRADDYSPEEWDWNSRSMLSMVSDWITLAPGFNSFIINMDPAVKVVTTPRVYWRDTWIG